MLSARFQLLCVILSSTCFFRQYVQSQGADAIVIKGSKFFYQNNGSQFFFKGIVYQQSTQDQGSVAQNLARNSGINGIFDSLIYPEGCIRDVPYLKDLQINVVRTYYIDPSQDHSKCIALLAKAGIYIMVDLMDPGYIITSVNPIWNNVLYNHYTSVIDMMHNYTNLLGFILGDDVAGGISQNDSGPYVKAAVRDIKAYIRQKNYRSIPVGYVNSFNNNNNISDYLNCGERSDDNIDFWGANIRNWCSSSRIRGNYADSGYANATSKFSSYSVPVFLAAYGCLDSTQRDFSEIDAIYGQLMSPVWSGGIFYQYFSVPTIDNPGSGYGLVQIPVLGNNISATASTYQNVSRHLATVSPSSINSGKYIPTNTAAACPVGAALSLPPNPIAMSLTTSSPRTSASSSTTTTPKVSNDALSTGGKVGIGIGLVVLVLALALGTFFIQRRALHKNRVDKGPWTKTELAADNVDREARGYGPHMADSTQRAEVEGSGVMREVQADSNEIFEAPGDLPTLPELWGTSRRGDSLMQNNKF